MYGIIWLYLRTLLAIYEFIFVLWYTAFMFYHNSLNPFTANPIKALHFAIQV